MISVAFQPEPRMFETQVRQPGRRFLARNPRPTSADFRREEHWRACLPELRATYGSLCCYTCLLIPTQASVDHFKPKSVYPTLAYEWRNFRLCMGRVNGHKGNSESVLDPFIVRDEWFQLDFATLFVKPNPSLQPMVFQRVRTTIEVLKLNIDDALVDLRFEAYTHYRDNNWSLAYLEQYSPFIARELVRQNLAHAV